MEKKINKFSCILFVLFVASSHQLSSSQKPKCATQLTPQQCRLSKFPSCVDDWNCTSEARCCSNGCGINVCAEVNSTIPPRLVCPNNRSLSSSAPANAKSCTTNKNCSSGQICCKFRTKGRVCVIPRRVYYKAGMCDPNLVNEKCHTKTCANDFECAGKQKCCGNGCVCKLPYAKTDDKTGTCPPASKRPCFANVTYVHNCSKDQECPGNKKCCSDGCSTFCRDPYITKPGICPTVVKACTGNIFYTYCLHDGNCRGDKKCCSDGCNTYCRDPAPDTSICRLPPVQDNINRCKAAIPRFTFDFLALRCVNFTYGGCNGTANLFNTLLECETACGALIVTPKPKCDRQETKEFCMRAKFAICTSDKNCTLKGTRCCNNGCADICGVVNSTTSTVSPSELICPPNSQPQKIPSNAKQCNMDRNCSSQFKCCPVGIKKYCVTPRLFTDKPGECPCATSAGICANTCEGDSTCPGLLKCCKNGCGAFTCTDPFKRRGSCPANVTYSAQEQSCASDGECFLLHKCCPAGNIYQCVRYVGEKIGRCPDTPVLLMQKKCSYDDECPGAQKCCNNYCDTPLYSKQQCI